MTGTILIRGAQVLTFDARDRQLPEADLLIRDRRIVAVEPRIEPASAAPDRVIDATGMLAMPGLINGHFHSPGTLMRGMLDGLPLELFMLYEVAPLAEQRPEPRLVHLCTQLAAAEMLKGGTTAVHDDAYHVPIATPDSIDAIMRAYAEIGMRATVAIDQPNVVEYAKFPFLADLLPDHLRTRMDRAPRQSTAELLNLYRHLISRWHGVEDGRLRASVSCSAPQRVTVDYLQGLAELGRKHDLPFNMHILETKLQRVLGEEQFGRSLVRYVRDLGVLDERSLVIHAVWVDDQDIEILAEQGAAVAHNPIANLRLGSGVMPFRRIADAGIPICLGSDEANVDDSVNMWLVAKVAGLIHGIGTPLEPECWPKAPEILNALIRGGASTMRLRKHIGQLTPGHDADLILLDVGTRGFTPLNDLRRQLVYCETGASVRLVMVAGRVVVEEGRLMTIDEAALRAEVAELMPRYRQAMAGVDAAARQLWPHYRSMYRKAAERAVGLNRWVT